MKLSPCLTPLALIAFGFAPANAQIDENTPTREIAISMPQTETAGSKVAVSVQIRTVRLVGVRSVPVADLISAAEKAIAGRQGEEDVIRTAATAVISVYRERRYTLAQITEAQLSPDGVLTLSVAEGTIRRVLIEGNTRTKTATVLRSLSLNTGDIFNEGKADADRQRLARLGIFAEVKVGPELPLPEKPETRKDVGNQEVVPPEVVPPEVVPPDPSEIPPKTTPPDAAISPTEPPTNEPPTVPPIGEVADRVGQVDLVVRVRETQTANIAATIGYADGMGAVGFVDVSENNLFGMAHRTSIQWQRTSQAQLRANGTFEPGDSRSAFSFSYEVPTIGPRGIGYGVDIYDKNTVFLPTFAGGQETIRSYERRRGFRAEVGRPLVGNLSLFLTARRDEVGYDAVPDRLNPPFAALADSFGTVGALGVMALMDGRDNVDNPRRGYRYSVQVERAGTFFGGNRQFTQVITDLRAYFPLVPPDPRDEKKPRPVLAVRFLGGTSSGDVPLSEQFFLGGFDLLRGYDLFSIRGDRAVLGTAELRIPLAESLQGVVFTDTGAAWEPGVSVSMTDLKVSLGAGVRFLSPIGPIRLDAAYGSRFQTYISLGQSF